MADLPSRINDNQIPVEQSAPGDYVAASRDIEGTPEDIALNIGQELADKALLSAINNDEDFYEEGTFPMGVRGATTAGDYSVSGDMTYTKKGNEYTLQVNVTITENSAGSGALEFTGLPAPQTVGHAVGSVMYSPSATFSVPDDSLVVNHSVPGSSSILRIRDQRGQVSRLVDNIDGATIKFTLTYR